jgi:hypothetical protein
MSRFSGAGSGTNSIQVLKLLSAVDDKVLFLTACHCTSLSLLIPPIASHCHSASYVPSYYMSLHVTVPPVPFSVPWLGSTGFELKAIPIPRGPQETVLSHMGLRGPLWDPGLP